MCATTTEAVRGTALLLCAALLAGCGGGVSVGIGIGDDDDPPRVLLSAFPAQVRVGQQFTLAADAHDDFGVFVVDFYEAPVIGGALRPLGRVVGRPPFEFPVIPVAAGTLRFEAQAVDNAGQGSRFAAVTVEVLP